MRFLPILTLLLPALAWAEPAQFELLYSQPVETDLSQPLRSPEKAWPELFADAKKTIDIEEFYLAHQPAEALQASMDALADAAQRGVHIRVLVEKKFWHQSEPTAKIVQSWPNTELRVLDWSKLDPGPQRKGGGIIHAKFFIVDGQIGYLGSQNFDWRSLKHIHELGVLSRSAHISAQLQGIFDHDWQAQALQAAGKPVPVLHANDRPEPERNDSGYLVASPHEWLPAGVGDSESELPHLIDTAKKRIQIQVLKYVPLDHAQHFYPVIDNAIRAAAARGVEVQLLVSDWNSDMPGQKWLQSLTVLPHVEVRMVTLPQAKSGYIPFARTVHSKYMVVDDAVLWVGTSNWEGGYLSESRNVEFISHEAELAKQGVALHQQLWLSPYAHKLLPNVDLPRTKREEVKEGRSEK